MAQSEQLNPELKASPEEIGGKGEREEREKKNSILASVLNSANHDHPEAIRMLIR